MELIKDDPIVSFIMQNGFPPWQMPLDWEDDEWDEEDGDVFFGNETAEF